MKDLITRMAQIGAMSAAVAGTALAQVPTKLEEGVQGAKPSGAPEGLFVAGGIFSKIADTLIFIVGAVAVIMLIIGGLRYVLSSGNSASVEGAKNTILYAIIGIIVAILSYAAVRFVIGQFGG